MYNVTIINESMNQSINQYEINIIIINVLYIVTSLLKKKFE